MQILIVGAGNAGTHLARKLCDMNHDIILVDPDETALLRAEQELNVMTIPGSGASPTLLEDTNVQKSDVLVAVTNLDEVNILACQYAKASGISHTVARISDESFLRSPILPLGELGIDLALSHKKACAEEIFNVLQNPGALEVSRLFGRRITAMGIRLPGDSPLLNHPLKEFAGNPQFQRVRFIGLNSRAGFTIPDGSTVLHANDEVYFVILADHVNSFLNWAAPTRPHRFDKVIIAGGGDLGLTIARMLEKSPFKTVLVEVSQERADMCSSELADTLVINGNAASTATLKDLRINNKTAFIASTDEDEFNIVSCIQAKQLEAGFTIAQINRPEYVPVIDRLSLLDKVTSPYLSIISTILSYVRGEQVHEVSLFNKLPGELLEMELSGGNRMIGRAINKLALPKGTIIAALRRGDAVHIVTGEFVLQENDRLITYCHPDSISKLRLLFK